MTVGEGSRKGEGAPYVIWAVLKAIPLLIKGIGAGPWASVPCRIRPRHASASLSDKKLHHSQQIDEFLTQAAILRRDFEPHVTNYRKIPAFIDREGPPWTRGTYDGGVGGGWGEGQTVIVMTDSL